MAHVNVYVHLFLWSTLVLVSHSASLPCAGPRKPRGFGSAKHAIIIGIDGLGAIYFRNDTQNLSNLDSFMQQGSYSTHSRGVYPTSSGPNWSVYLTGMEPMQSGVFDNHWTIANGDPVNSTSYSIPPLSGRGIPWTIFRQVKQKDRNLTTSMMFTWKWFKNFAVNNTDVDEWFWGEEGITCNETGTETKVECTQREDWNTLNHTLAYIKKNKPTLTFVQLDALDYAGHETCWGCPNYYEVLSEKDKQIKMILDTLNQTVGTSGKPMLNETLVVVVADHGGWKNRHNFELPFSALVDIPILMRGPGVIKNKSLEEEEVSSLDVAVTILNALGIEKNHFMKGRVLDNIYPPLSSLPSPTLSPTPSSSLSPTSSPVKPKCAGSVFISSFSLILLLLAMFILISPF